LRSITILKVVSAIAAIVLPIALLRACLPGAAERFSLSSLGPGFEKVERSGLIFLSDVGARELQDLASRIEAFATALSRAHGERLSLATHRESDGVRLVVCARREDYERLRDKYGAGRHAGAFYSPNARTLVLHGHGGPGSPEFLATVFHEVTHLLADLGGHARGAAWLQEGLAGYFEGSQVHEEPSGLRAEVGGPAPHWLRRYAQGGGVTIEDLLSASDDEFYGRKEDFADEPTLARKAARAEALYATAACLVGTLVETSRETLGRAIAEHRAQRTVTVRWLARELETKPAEIDAKVRAWAKARTAPASGAAQEERER
jgi:hypothetical protein